MKVTVLDDYQRAFDSTDAIKRLRQQVEVEIFTEKLPTDDAIVGALRGSQAIIPIRERTKFTASLLRGLRDLEFISQTGSHVYHVDMDAATKQGIVVSLAPGGNSTTELAFGLMLALMRRIPQSDRAIRRGEWALVLGYVLKGKTLGVLGLGKIGTEVAAVGRAFGMKVIAWGPTLTAERAAKSAAAFLPLEEVLKTSDVVSIHLTLSEKSKNLLNEPRLRLMKKSAYLVNTARGAIVDEMALVKILKDKDIGPVHSAGVIVVHEQMWPLVDLRVDWADDNPIAGLRKLWEAYRPQMQDYVTRALNPEALQHRKPN